MSRPNQNNELDKISNIIGNTPGLRKEDNIPYILSSENNTFHLESNNTSFYLNLPIFRHPEERNKNNTIKDEKSPTENKELYLIENLKNIGASPKKPFTTLTKKRRGRSKQERKQKEINVKDNEDNDYIKIHDKHTADNLLKKIQVHYLTFIVRFLNEIFKFVNLKQRFRNLAYEFKSNVNKEFVNSLKTKTIGDIISTQISIKYKKVALNINKNIYEQTKFDTILNKIFSENYLLFFRKVYFKSERIINLKEYGLNQKLILSEKAKMYKDLIENKDYVYKRYLKDCVNRHFFSNSLFTTE